MRPTHGQFWTLVVSVSRPMYKSTGCKPNPYIQAFVKVLFWLIKVLDPSSATVASSAFQYCKTISSLNIW